MLVSSEFSVIPEQLTVCQKKLGEIELWVARLANKAGSSAPAMQTWGFLGQQFSEAYWGSYVERVHSELNLISKGLRSSVVAMDATREGYTNSDDAIARVFKDDNSFNVPLDVKPQHGVTVLGVPLSEIRAVFTEDDWHVTEDTMAAFVGIGGTMASFVKDPFQSLIAAGLEFLVEYVQPINDLLSYATGDPARMQAESSLWTNMRSSLQPLAEQLRAAANEGLFGWEGEASEAARERLNDFADGILAVSCDMRLAVIVLEAASLILEATRQVIYSVLASVIEFLIATWIAAAAAAVPSLGAALAAAELATTLRCGCAAVEIVEFLQRAGGFLARLSQTMSKTTGDAVSQAAIRTSRSVMKKSAKSSGKSAVKDAAKGSGGLFSEIDDYVKDEHRVSDAEIKRLLAGD